MGKLSRTKGHAFEREIANLLERIPGVMACRNVTETQQGNRGDIVTNLPIMAQCKVGAMPPIYAAIDQAVEAASGLQMPVAFIRRNATAGRGKHDLMVVRLNDGITLLDCFWSHTNP